MAANIPGLRLTLDDGTDLADKIDPRLLLLSLTEKRGGESDALELTIQNHDGAMAIPKKGIYLSLALGWIDGNDVTPGLIEKGRFKVDEVELEGPPDIVIIRARAADMTGVHRKRKDKAWKDTTLGAIITTIASEDGQSASVHPDLAGIQIKAIEQGTKSNKLFVKHLGRRYDAVATWKNKTLIFMPIGSTTTASGKAIPTFRWTKQSGWKWTFRAADHDDFDGAEAQYHDQDTAKTKTVKTGGKKRKRLKKTYASKADAEAAAKSEAARSKRTAYAFTYDLSFGDPSVIPNARVALTGWNSQIDAIKWIVEEVSHSFGSGGLTTSVTLETAE